MLEITQDNNPLQVLEQIIPALECLKRLNEFDHWPLLRLRHLSLALSLGFTVTPVLFRELMCSSCPSNDPTCEVGDKPIKQKAR